MDGLERLNRAAEPAARRALLFCCGSSRWAERMARARPFRSKAELVAAARRVWRELEPRDWLEAFAHHPRIGDKEALRRKFATRQWAAGEQAAAAAGPEWVLEALAEGNARYERKFGRIFIVCASGKTASEMLDILNRRLANDQGTELEAAASEQAKITQLRLEGLIT